MNGVRTALLLPLWLPASTVWALQAPWPDTPDPALRPCTQERTAAVARATTLQADVAASACKAWPSVRGATVFAVAFHDPKAMRLQLAVGVIEDDTVRGWHLQDIEEDATLDATQLQLRLDTAPYLLAAGVRAFGVDLNGGYSANCADTTLGATRTLYAWATDAVRPVLTDLQLSSTTLISGDRGRCGAPEQAAQQQRSVLERMRATIALGAGTTNGWQDLLVTQTRSRNDGSAPRRLTQRFTYDGHGYRRR